MWGVGVSRELWGGEGDERAGRSPEGECMRGRSDDEVHPGLIPPSAPLGEPLHSRRSRKEHRAQSERGFNNGRGAQRQRRNSTEGSDSTSEMGVSRAIVEIVEKTRRSRLTRATCRQNRVTHSRARITGTGGAGGRLPNI